ncbi:MAG TPA: protein kinase [Vicinamibacterales bacterium]|nr:protein kinase [Vicinamibacterales bacterium]
MTPQRISHYHVLRRLGHGGMGEIYLAEDSRLGRRVALKLLPPQLQADAPARARFVAEARAAAAIDHPYVCKVYDASDEDGVAFIAMEFIEGTSLEERLAQGALPPPEAVRLASEIAEALAKAHERGVIHRDLKPSNVMLATDGHVKVVDFGIAKRISTPDDVTAGGVTREGVTLGTPRYMSPEQVRGLPLDPRSDLFSLGLILYEMIAGAHPFARDHPVDAAIAIVTEPTPSLPATTPVPTALHELLARLLSKAPATRERSAAEVAAALRDLFTRQRPAVEVAASAASIVVLPFANRTGKEDEEYFSDGMTEEMIVRLSKISGLRVISLGTSLHFKNSGRQPADIGRELGVGSVLEGSVRRAGAQVRITASLTDTMTATQLWGETYDRPAEDVFAVQADVAGQIVQALRAQFPGVGVKAGTHSGPQPALEAYHLYLKGWHAAARSTPDGFQQGWRFFRQALDLDPTYARGYAGLAMTYARAGNFGYLPAPDAFSQAKAAAMKALEFDPYLAEAHAAAALVAFYYEWNWPAAEESFLEALRLNESYADAHQYYSLFLASQLRHGEALMQARRALELNPLSPAAGANVALVLTMAGRYDEALEDIEKLRYLHPDFLPGHVMLASTLLYVGRYDEAITLLAQWSWTRAHVGYAHALAGRRDEARAIYNDLLAANYRGAFDLTVLALLLGDVDEGVRWLERAIDQRDNKLFGLRAMFASPLLPRAVVADPRIQALVARIGPRP